MMKQRTDCFFSKAIKTTKIFDIVAPNENLLKVGSDCSVNEISGVSIQPFIIGNVNFAKKLQLQPQLNGSFLEHSFTGPQRSLEYSAPLGIALKTNSHSLA